MVSVNKINNYITNVKLDRKPVNALNYNMIQELKKIVSSIEDSKTRCIIFSSNIKHFCAGADLDERKNMDSDETISFLDNLNILFHSIEKIKVPTIASINGACLGGGLEFALACDFRISSKKSIFGFPETSIGIIPGAGGTQRLVRLVGISNAKKWIFSSNNYNASQALADGIIDCINIKDNIDTTIQFARNIVKNAPIAIKAAKSAINQAFIDHGFIVEREEYLRTLHSKDRDEGLLSFDEKRDPKWLNS